MFYKGTNVYKLLEPGMSIRAKQAPEHCMGVKRQHKRTTKRRRGEKQAE